MKLGVSLHSAEMPAALCEAALIQCTLSQAILKAELRPAAGEEWLVRAVVNEAFANLARCDEGRKAVVVGLGEHWRAMERHMGAARPEPAQSSARGTYKCHLCHKSGLAEACGTVIDGNETQWECGECGGTYAAQARVKSYIPRSSERYPPLSDKQKDRFLRIQN